MGVDLRGTTVRDWEDIAVNIENGISYIYLGDIGDNKNLGPPTRDSLTIYKFKEPSVSPDWSEHDIVVNAEEIEHIHVRCPMGQGTPRLWSTSPPSLFGPSLGQISPHLETPWP